MKNLTKSEKEIMNVLWRAERALTHAEIVSACVERKWRARSIFEMLNSLLDKGYVRAVGYVIAIVIRGKLSEVPESIPLRRIHLLIFMFMIFDAATILTLICRTVVNLVSQIAQLV